MYSVLSMPEEQFETQEHLDETRPAKGRPTLFSKELGDEICALIAEGKSLRSICLAASMPDKSTIFRWLRKYEDFRDQYALAKEDSAHALAEEILEIADDGVNDFVEQITKSGETKVVVDKENIMRSRLRVDARKWLASKLLPKKYGAKVDVTSGDEPLKQAESTSKIVAAVEAILKSGDNNETQSGS